MDTEKAYLSNDKDMIQFRYGDKIIRFRGPYSLERFISIKEWDNGYIVVMQSISIMRNRRRNILI